jgi:PadR family transcriptional regulator PadR
MEILSRAEEIILLAVAKLPGEAYGVTIRRQVQKDIGRRWSFGIVYKTLKKLRAKGYVRRIASAPLPERGGRSRFYYELTSDGLVALEEILRIHHSLWEGATGLILGEKN